MEPRAARALRRAGFDLLDLANNHILDCGSKGLEETLHYLTAAGVQPFGAGRTATQAHRPVVRAVRGVRFAFLGYFPGDVAVRSPAAEQHLLRGLGHRGTARGALALIRRDIRRARQHADVVLVSLHMGDRYQRSPTRAERRHCRGIIDAGADAVVAHGTHIMGPVERYRGRPILYSLGNFAFGSGNIRARFSLMAFLEVDPTTRRLTGVQFLPIYTVNHNPWIRFQTKVLVGRQARRVIRRLQRLSRPLGGPVQLRSRPVRGILSL
jgi:poly-gamma-glutamate synthesis protein (capsule biosynthesis protein)